MPQVADDLVLAYGRAKGWELRPRTVLVEGTTDEALFRLAARLEREHSGIDLLADELAFVAAGIGDAGGTRGVANQLLTTRNLARTVLLPSGRLRYRFIGLVDNDDAGRRAIRGARQFDTSILEYRDLFRIRPRMPRTGNLDPRTLERSFDRLNRDYRELDWELEDLVAQDFVESFLDENPTALRHEVRIEDKIHRKLSPDGKSRLNRYVQENAILADLQAVLAVIRSVRFILNLPKR